MFAPTYDKSVRQAKANADTFGVPYIVFQDTSGNWRCERARDDVTPGSDLARAERFHPTAARETSAQARRGTLAEWLAKYNARAHRYGAEDSLAVMVFDSDTPGPDARWELYHLTDYAVTSSVSGPARVLCPIDPDTGYSLAEKMWSAYQLSLQILYEPREDGQCVNLRPNAPDDEDVWAWADGLMHAYYERMEEGRCSLQAQLDFDVGAFEATVDATLIRFTTLLRELA